MNFNQFYAPKGMYAWDFWLVQKNSEFHLFHLQAPRILPPVLRHNYASVGHAISQDLINWEYQGTVFEAGKQGCFDDGCIWTGSILPYNEKYYFLYTGRSKADGLIQRIGLAISDDLHHFERYSESPLIEADPQFYQTYQGNGPKVEDFRDPYLFIHKGKICALITATLPSPDGDSTIHSSLQSVSNILSISGPLGLDRLCLLDGKYAGRGCIALAKSEDFVNWQIHRPLFAPGRYSYLECPQLIEHEGLFYLFFSVMRGAYTKKWAKIVGKPESGLHGYVSESLDGPYRPLNGTGIVLGQDSHCYATRIFRDERDPESPFQALSWLFPLPQPVTKCCRISHPQQVLFNGENVRISQAL